MNPPNSPPPPNPPNPPNPPALSDEDNARRNENTAMHLQQIHQHIQQQIQIQQQQQQQQRNNMDRNNSPSYLARSQSSMRDSVGDNHTALVPLPFRYQFVPGGAILLNHPHTTTSSSTSTPTAFSAPAASPFLLAHTDTDMNRTSSEALETTSPTPIPTRTTPQHLWKVPQSRIQQAYLADVRLHWYRSLSSQSQGQSSQNDHNSGMLVPSLSILASWTMGRLTGCDPVSMKDVCDMMLLTYYNDYDNRMGPLSNSETADTTPLHLQISEEDLWNDSLLHHTLQAAFSSCSTSTAKALPRPTTAVEALKQCAPSSAEAQRGRPCGYVFQRGDIAWNCRTCQTDPTCVICDNCFRLSDHTGHEVYFHRTLPGGCCDCGDVEAWNINGCCPLHRPPSTSSTCKPATTPSPLQQRQSSSDRVDASDEDYIMEAVHTSAAGYAKSVEVLQHKNTQLPPLFVAALGAVIGAAVHAIGQTMEGAGIGADPSQWRLKWAEEGAQIRNGAAYAQEYYINHHPQINTPSVSVTATEDATTTTTTVTQQTLVSPALFIQLQEPLPEGYKLHLRLHNDDVHTFDEVIDALHEPRRSSRTNDTTADLANSAAESLVMLRESAIDMTHHVDSDGQVIVKTYSTLHEAMQGFKRLKSRGLQCAVVSNLQELLEVRSKHLLQYLSDLAAAHPVAAALVTHALVSVNPQHAIAGVHVWRSPRSIPVWTAASAAASSSLDFHPCEDPQDMIQFTRRRFAAFPPHLESSFVTFEEAERLHEFAVSINAAAFTVLTGAPLNFYDRVPYRLCPDRYLKSPHALWGTLPEMYHDPVLLSSVGSNIKIEPVHYASKHPLLHRLVSINTPIHSSSSSPTWDSNDLTELVYIVDTDLRKQQEADQITSSVYPHKLPGLHLISGLATIKMPELSSRRPSLPSPMDHRQLLASSSFRAPSSPLLVLLLLDPYPTKQVRVGLHALFLSLFTDSRFRNRFASAMGVAYRPLTTLFCAGVGTEADTPLHFTVQILTAGSLVRALCNGSAMARLLLDDDPRRIQQQLQQQQGGGGGGGGCIGVFCSPIAHTIVRCIHTNLLGATKEVNMILNNTGRDDYSQDRTRQNNDALLPALTYVAGEHPLLTPLPAAPDDGFLDSRSTRHKRLPHLLRDLEYVVETPSTSLRLLLAQALAVPALSGARDEILTFSSVYARMLRLGQGMDPQKRKISGGHVEYEHNRWLEAFGLSLTFAGTRDALSECPANAANLGRMSHDGAESVRVAIGNLIAALIREIKFWLYREGMLETGLLAAPAHGSMELAQAEALQRSTLHVSRNQFDTEVIDSSSSGSVSTVALACATGVKMTEAQLILIENALRAEDTEKLHSSMSRGGNGVPLHPHSPTLATSPLMGDWLRVPHSPLAGDSLSFHLPLHRALAKCIKSLCGNVVTLATRQGNPGGWWKLPVLDGDIQTGTQTKQQQHPLVPLIRSTLRSSNCRIVWTAGPDCSAQEAQRRRSRARTVSAIIAVAKIIHSIADHPIRCIAAAQQIERHLWARNGSSVAGMAVNYSSTPLCRSFLDLDILMVQLSASGLSLGLGARRVFGLLLSRFSMDGYLCDPEKRSQAVVSPGGASYGLNVWINPPRLQDPDHAIILAESLLLTLCVIVTELPPPPPSAFDDDSSLRQGVRRELIHALAAEPRSHSEAMSAASAGISRREETDGGSINTGAVNFRAVFSEVLNEVGKQRSQGSSRTSIGPPTYELKPDYCDEYDPTFFHLRRQEHQHAMDVISRLRKQRQNDKDTVGKICHPIVCHPPKAHPRFIPCRLLLHLQTMDAAIRRLLLFALTGGSWLPPPEPLSGEEKGAFDNDEFLGASTSTNQPRSGDVSVKTFTRHILRARTPNAGSISRRNSSGNDSNTFSSDVVAASSVSFLEVLQLLTLQVHTLEECAALHRTLSDLDDESRVLSASLSINSYLGRLVFVPESLLDCWIFKPYPDGPLQSKGSGDKRGSVLGLLIALYEHRPDHSTPLDTDGAGDGHGGARVLVSSGLKWLLRFVSALVDRAPSVGAAIKAASLGIPIHPSCSVPSIGDLGCSSWTIDDELRSTIRAMLFNLPDLWPAERQHASQSDKSNTKAKETGKTHQLRMLEMMKQKQNMFAAMISDTEQAGGKRDVSTETNSDECIICRCGDADGENNGPLGFLGHVQRSRNAQIRAGIEGSCSEGSLSQLYTKFRVVGHMGCQLRETEAMDSRPLTCLPKGSVVTLIKTKISDLYDVLSRRVFVRHVTVDPLSKQELVEEGWASLESSTGYMILSPLSSTCYLSTSWGGTRPTIRHCGHVAHLKCVETHTLSLHQRAAGDQPYDGRFAANIADGEFLCPLCKQLSNILIPRDICKVARPYSFLPRAAAVRPVRTILGGDRLRNLSENDFTGMTRRAMKDFGSHLYNAMNVPWERSMGSRRKKHIFWNHAIQKWDFEAEDDASPFVSTGVKGVLRLLRQQLIAWSSIGHSASSAESCFRGVEEVLPFGAVSNTTDPWSDYNEKSRISHPSLLELKRTMTAACGLLEVMCLELKEASAVAQSPDDMFFVGACLAEILEGRSWLSHIQDSPAPRELSLWSELTALTVCMPCHVSRDGVLPHRSEARATAAAMWALKGVGSSNGSRGVPPAPLAIHRLIQVGHPHIPSDWGTMNPFVNISGNALTTPIRPVIASSYLCKPMLVWDLSTLAAGIFSSVLANNPGDLPSSDELMYMGKMLITARMIQVLVTPYGFELPDEMDVDSDDNECWNGNEVEVEGRAIMNLYLHCQDMIGKFGGSNSQLGIKDASPLSFLTGVGYAVLPFSRSLILMLRACTAAIHDRQSSMNKEAASARSTDDALDPLLVNKDLMTCENGFYVIKALASPLPSEILRESSEWKERIDRWLLTAAGFERHLGSSGKSVLPIPSTILSIPTKIVPVTNNASASAASLVGRSLEVAVSTDSAISDDMEITEIEENRRRNEPFPLDFMEEDDDNEDDQMSDMVDDNVSDMIDDGDDIDEAEEMVDFPLAPVTLGPALAAMLGASPGVDGHDLDDDSSSGTEGDNRDPDREFAHLGRSPIMPYQPGILGLYGIGPGRLGSGFNYAIASSVMADLSHLGSIHRKDRPTFCLIRLPKSFVELYNVVNKIKWKGDAGLNEDGDDTSSSSDTAICLLTGRVMRSGSSKRGGLSSRASRPPGACTLHARKHGSGIGMFFLIQKCTVLLMHNNKSAYSPSIYVDEHGEEDPGLRRGRPLIMNDARYRSLESLWRQQGIPREVAQIRSTADRVIRDNWY